MKTLGNRIAAIGMAATALAWVPARAQSEGVYFRVVSATTTVITAFSPDGTIAWSNAAVGVTGRIQRATSLTGVRNWTDFEEYTATGTVMVLPTGDYMVVDLLAGPSASNYPVSYLTSGPAGGWSDEYKTTKLVMRRIPAGTFSMGSPADELGRVLGETQHQVSLTQPFYLGVFEVTQKQWNQVMNTWPSYFTNASGRESRPVEQVPYSDIRGSNAGTNWPANGNVDANSFMGRLRARTGKAFDLPTEAQWEYAGRAGATTALNSGKNLSSTKSDPNMNEVGRYYYNGGSNYLQAVDTVGATAKVGSYLPNAWGLYDFHGNVWEWCLDWFDTYTADTVSDPKGATQGANRAGRGGSFVDGPDRCRIAMHDEFAPATNNFWHMGFRTALPKSQTR